jgi:hypothetical protein
MRALLLLTLLLTVGEVTGLLDAALQLDCASCSTADQDGCALCPCCSQGRLLCADEAQRLPAPALVAELDLGAPRLAPVVERPRIFHPPRSAQG